MVCCVNIAKITNNYELLRLRGFSQEKLKQAINYARCWQMRVFLFSLNSPKFIFFHFHFFHFQSLNSDKQLRKEIHSANLLIESLSSNSAF